MTKWDLKLCHLEISDLSSSLPSDFSCQVSCTAWNNNYEETEIAQNTIHPKFQKLFKIPIGDFSKDRIYIKLVETANNRVLSDVTIPVEQIPPGVGIKHFQLIPMNETEKGGTLQFEYIGKECDESNSYSSDGKNETISQPFIRKDESQSSSIDLTASRPIPPPQESSLNPALNHHDTESHSQDSAKNSKDVTGNQSESYSYSYSYLHDSKIKKTKATDDDQSASNYSYYSSNDKQINLGPKEGSNTEAVRNQENRKSSALLSTLSSIEIAEYDLNSSSTSEKMEPKLPEPKYELQKESNANPNQENPRKTIDKGPNGSNQETPKEVENGENNEIEKKTESQPKTAAQDKTSPKKQKKNNDNDHQGGCCSIY